MPTVRSKRGPVQQLWLDHSSPGPLELPGGNSGYPQQSAMSATLGADSTTDDEVTNGGGTSSSAGTKPKTVMTRQAVRKTVRQHAVRLADIARRIRA